jgi:hypothetical protein
MIKARIILYSEGLPLSVPGRWTKEAKGAARLWERPKKKGKELSPRWHALSQEVVQSKKLLYKIYPDAISRYRYISK